LYIVAGDSTVGYITTNGYSGSIVGIGNVMNFSSSVDGRLNAFVSTGSNQFNGSQSISGSITLSGSINNLNYISFDTASVTPVWKSGTVYWNNIDGCLDVYNAEADITLQVGQENWTRVYNGTATTITNGTPVRITGTHGDTPKIELAQSIAVSGSVNLVNQIIGLATHNIEAGTFGYVTTQGLVRGVNTNAFNDGDTLYVSSSAGQLTNRAIGAPYEIIPIGEVVKAGPGGSGIIYVAVQQPLDFSDLSSVYVSGTFSDGDIFQYNGSGVNGKWRHKSISDIGLVVTSSFNSFTSSINTFTSSVNTTTASLNSKTGSYATTGSNALTGSQIVSGSLTVTGSVAGNVIALSVASGTASIDFRAGTFFTLTIPSSSITHITASNMQPGLTANLVLTQQATTGSVRWDSGFKFPSGSFNTGSASGSAVDIVSMMMVNTSQILSVGANRIQ
jgi:predicted RecA/RadA family phage recombinase